MFVFLWCALSFGLDFDCLVLVWLWFGAFGVSSDQWAAARSLAVRLEVQAARARRREALVQGLQLRWLPEVLAEEVARVEVGGFTVALILAP